jgi:HEAT repeat protein
MARIVGAARGLAALLLREVSLPPGRRHRVPLLALLFLLGCAAAAVVFVLVNLRHGGAADEVGPWAARLGDPDPDVRLEARWTLMAKGAPAVPALVEALRGDNPLAREEAAAALAGLAPRAPIGDAVPALVEALDDPDPLVRLNAIDALRHAGPRAGEAMPRLRRALDDDDRHVRANAARTLKELKQGGTEPGGESR